MGVRRLAIARRSQIVIAFARRFLREGSDGSANLSSGANSPLQTGKGVVLPAFLAMEGDAKTMVIRPRATGEKVSLNYYIARGGDATLGQPDIAPADREQISIAVQEVADGSGLTASTTFAVHGIKYLFLKSPVDENIARVIDGLGGFARASSTTVGIVWKISVNTGDIIFTNRLRSFILDLEIK